MAAADPGDAGISEEKLVLERLRYLVAHEVGHTLGLMHDWAAMTFGWGSVMDICGQCPGGLPTGLRTRIRRHRSHDRLMIRWGYSADGSLAQLDAIVRTDTPMATCTLSR
jgi:hypothetical protein